MINENGTVNSTEIVPEPNKTMLKLSFTQTGFLSCLSSIIEFASGNNGL